MLVLLTRCCTHPPQTYRDSASNDRCPRPITIGISGFSAHYVNLKPSLRLLINGIESHVEFDAMCGLRASREDCRANAELIR